MKLNKKIFLIIIFCLSVSACVKQKDIQNPECTDTSICSSKTFLFSEFKKKNEEKAFKKNSYQQAILEIEQLLDQYANDWVAGDFPALLSHYWPNKSPVKGVEFQVWWQQVYNGLPQGKSSLRFYDIELLPSPAGYKNHVRFRVKQERINGKKHDFSFKQIGLVNSGSRWLIDTEVVISYTLLSDLDNASDPDVSVDREAPSESHLSNPKKSCSVLDLSKEEQLYTIQLFVPSQLESAKKVSDTLGSKAYVYLSTVESYVSVYDIFKHEEEAMKQLKVLRNNGRTPRDIFVTELNTEKVKRFFAPKLFCRNYAA